MLRKPFFFISCALAVSSLHVHAVEENLKPLIPNTSKENVPSNVPNDSITVIQQKPALTSPTTQNQGKTISFEPFTGAITGAKVRMRTQPGIDSHVVRETSSGEMFGVVNEVGEYYAVVPPKGTKGYVFRTFILNDTVEGERVNVRLYPDIDAPVIAQLNRGDRVSTKESEMHPKWLTLDLPQSSRFYIAKEYIEKRGDIHLIGTIEKRKHEAIHHLNAVSLFAQSEIQKPFEQIDFDKIKQKFNQISKEYHDLPTVNEHMREIVQVFQDIYVQKKIAFLEGKVDQRCAGPEMESAYISKLAKIGIEIKPNSCEKPILSTSDMAAQEIGFHSGMPGSLVTDKMGVWQPLEDSLYHFWAASNNEKTVQDFYSEEEQNATVLTGMVEPYLRPVKNRPGDFLLKCDNRPVAFLYSTLVNLEKHVGQQVTVIAAPRPNHNFAFPAYFVINIE